MSTKRLDHLREIETTVQSAWRQDACFDVEALPESKEDTYFVTFPYPYMNGRLHLGHAFSLTKAEFMARYQRHAGKRVLWPFAFHGTGMPIAASADKIKREVAEAAAGPVDTEVVAEELADPAQPTQQAKGKSKRSKAVAKTGGAKTQTEILLGLGVPEEEIPDFADPRHWLKYFIPRGKIDLELFGISVDWRRSFVTTDANSYYDAFIQWQFRTLYKRNRLKFGLRPSIFSPLDAQPCADHDRSVGEAVQPRARVGYFCKIVNPTAQVAKLTGDKPAYFVSTCENPSQYHCNVVIDKETEYGFYYAFDKKLTPKELDEFADRQAVKGVAIIQFTDDEARARCPKLIVCTERIARHFAYQGIVPAMKSAKEPLCVGVIKGTDLAEMSVQNPFACPVGQVVATDLKIPHGTGSVVALIPGGLKTIGEETVKAAVVDNDAVVKANNAVIFDEAETRVVARSGSECIVALCNQWYTDFGDPEWKQLVMKHVSNPETFEAFGQRASYERTIMWLEGWACSRNYGLGTYLPWERERGNKIVIESLSDSTIYFAYYTIAHYLQGNVFGTKPGQLDIKASDLNDAAFDYIFCQTDELPGPASPIPGDKLQTLRTSFEYWYPMSLRCSGKDLVANHLTMALFHHAAIWPNRPDLWPRGYYVNGHVMVDGEKMSKSLGNFLTLTDACNTFSVDGTRIALAEAGDTCDDSNFERSTANSALMKNYVLLQFVEDLLVKKAAGKLRQGERNVVDNMFESQVEYLVSCAQQAYESMLMRDAVKYGYFEMLAARDMYRNILDDSLEYHEEAIFGWIKKFCVILDPIAPHICEHIWKLVGAEGFVSYAQFPPKPTDQKYLVHQLQYRTLQKFVEEARTAIDKATKPKKKGAQPDKPAKVSVLRVFVAKKYPIDKRSVLEVISKNVEFDPKTLMPVNPKGWTDAIKNSNDLTSLVGNDKKAMAQLMAFASHKVKRVSTDGLLTLHPDPLFDEEEFLKHNIGYLLRTLGVESIVVTEAADQSVCPSALPLAPAFLVECC